jgi:hypothetical protein
VSDSAANVLALVQAATYRGGWWESARGKQARRYLEGWGAVHRERLLTGDSTAFPRSSSGCGGPAARSEDGLATIVMIHDSVEAWIAGRTPMQRKLLRWIYIRGQTDQVLAVAYRLPNGSISDPCAPGDPVPDAFLAYESVISLAEGVVQTRSIGEFPGMVPFRAVLRMWGVPWDEFLEMVHVRLGQQLVKDLE